MNLVPNNAFAHRNTHHLTVVQSIDDIAKANCCDYEEIHEYVLSARKVLLANCKHGITKTVVKNSKTMSINQRVRGF